ncbi:MAG TPA: DUF3788 family protein [Candidatus Limnocylindrales bacterium]|nr:DUF3788 family protein [Candidatus Limnocylindrales bacterium]
MVTTTPVDAGHSAAAALPPSAFVDKASQPTDDAVERGLGVAAPFWLALRSGIAVAFAPVDEGWTYSGRKHGWALRLRQRDRSILYLTPLAGGLRASLALPERAVPVALDAGLPATIRAIVATAVSNSEGRAVRIDVRSDEDVAGVLALARIRMAS